MTKHRFLSSVNALRLLLSSAIFIVSPITYATNEAPQTITLDGRLYSGSSLTSPLLDSSVTIRAQILSPDGACVLYEETQNLSTASTNGYYNIEIGSNIGDAKRTGDDPNNKMSLIFQNRTLINSTNSGCATGYTPTAGATRKLKLQITPSSTGVTETMSPDVVLNSVPHALVAETLQGYDASSFLLSSSSGAQLPQVAGVPGTPTTGGLWFNSVSNQLQFYDGGSVRTLGTAGAGVSSVTVTSDLTADAVAGGTLTAPGTVGLANSGVTAGTYPKVTVDAKGRVTAGSVLLEADIPTLSTAGKVSGNALNSGTIAGSTAINTSGNITTSGNISANAANFRSLVLTNAGSQTLTLLPPVVITGTPTFTWPGSTGTANQVLQTDGSGVLSWVDVSSAAMTSLTGDVTASGTGAVATTISTNAVTTGKILDGTIAPTDLNFAGVMAVNTGLIVRDGTQFHNKTCAANEVLAWNIVNGWTCTSIVLTESDPQVGTNTLNFLSKWDGSALVTSGVFESSGNVGVGTATPATRLDVSGGLKLGTEASACVAGLAGTLRFNAGNIEFCNGTVWSAFTGVATSGITGLNGATGASQSFATPGSSGTAPNWSTNTGTGVHTLNIPMANTAGVTAGLLSKTDFDLFNAKLSTVGGASLTSAQIWVGNASNQAAAVPLSGDVSLANTGAATVTALRGRTLATTAPTNGQVLTWNNGASEWEPSTPTIGITALTGDMTASGSGSVTATIAANAVTTGKILDGTIAPTDLNFASVMATNTGILVRDGTQFHNKTCSGNETLIWSVSNGWICSAVTLSESDPQVGANTTNYLSKWDGSALVTSAVFESSGNVGIGTISPAALLTIANGANDTANYGRALQITNANGNRQQIAFIRNGFNVFSMGYNGASNIWGIGTGNTTDASFTTNFLAINASSGHIGIGNTNPGAMLDISGNATIDSTGLITSRGTGLNGGFRTLNPTGGRDYRVIQKDSGVFIVTDESAGQERLTITSAGNVGMSMTSGAEKLEVNGNVKATAFISTSDGRLKKDIETTSGLETILKLRGVKYRWKSNDIVEYGTIAQEVEEVLPDLVVTNKETGYKAVKYTGFIAPLIEATKELNQKCEMNTAQSQALQQRVQLLNQQVQTLQRELAAVREENQTIKLQMQYFNERLKKLEENK